LLKRRKEELLDYNRKVFANIEKELPKFADELGEDKKWWTKRSDYNPIQTTKSAKEFNLKKKKGF
jgi:predicted DNA binding CopG/RHH family protein